MFESIITNTTENSISMNGAIIGIVVAVVLGLLIGVVYMLSCKKTGFHKDFIVGLVLLPIIVAVVIMLVGSNVARAFSMAGAFALVRFRSAPGSAKDIAVVFLAMAIGLSCGLGYIGIAVIVTIMVALLLVMMSLTKFAEISNPAKQLKITIPENLNYTNVFDEIFQKYTKGVELKRVKTTNMGTMFELTYAVQLKSGINEKEMIDDLRVRNGNLNISLGLAEINPSVLNS